MASMYSRLMPQQTFAASQRPSRDEVIDVGAYRVLEFQARITTGGGGGNLIIEHAAVNEPGAFIALTGMSWPANTPTNDHKTCTSFLRYIRWGGDATVSGSPVALIDVIAKE